MNRQNEREEMVRTQLIRRGISDGKVLDAFKKVPRHIFVPPGQVSEAYGDYPLPIGSGQTISQPYIVALMTELACVQPGGRVLEIGTGCAYQAAILHSMGAKVYSVERKKELADRAEALLKKLQINDIKILVGDGTLGWPENAPYDSIIVTAAAPEPPLPLFKQLAEGGRLVVPAGSRLLQELMVFVKTSSGIKSESHGGCRFVPLIGKYGWKN